MLCRTYLPWPHLPKALPPGLQCLPAITPTNTLHWSSSKCHQIAASMCRAGQGTAGGLWLVSRLAHGPLGGCGRLPASHADNRAWAKGRHRPAGGCAAGCGGALGGPPGSPAVQCAPPVSLGPDHGALDGSWQGLACMVRADRSGFPGMHCGPAAGDVSGCVGGQVHVGWMLALSCMALNKTLFVGNSSSQAKLAAASKASSLLKHDSTCVRV